MKQSFFCLLMLSGVVLSACPSPQQIDIIEREQRRIRGANTKIAVDNRAIRSEINSVRSSLADTRANLQQVTRDVNAIREKLDEVQYQIGRQLGQSNREGGQRIKELEGQIVRIDKDLKAQGTLLEAREAELRIFREALMAKKESGGIEGSKEKINLEVAKSSTELAGEKLPIVVDVTKRDYDKARKLLEQKDYLASIDEFKKFLKKYPLSDYADNAQYWIGESYYALRKFDQAILEFDVVRRKYPKGDKVPAALLKQGFAFAELGDKVDARLILRDLIDRYSSSPEALKAKEKLKTLES